MTWDKITGKVALASCHREPCTPQTCPSGEQEGLGTSHSSLQPSRTYKSRYFLFWVGVDKSCSGPLGLSSNRERQVLVQGRDLVEDPLGLGQNKQGQVGGRVSLWVVHPKCTSVSLSFPQKKRLS